MKPSTTLGAGLALLALGTAPLAAATDDVAGHDADRAAISLVLDDEGAGWLAGNADAFAAHVTPDVLFVNIVGMYSVGKAPFVAQHASIFATIYKGSQMRQTLVSLTFPKPEVALVETICKLTGFQSVPSGSGEVDGALYTRLEQVMVKNGGKWSVASFHNAPIAPKFVTDEVKALTAPKGH